VSCAILRAGASLLPLLITGILSKCSLRSEIPLIGSRLGAGWQIIRREPRG
jgi:hypothetical protein